MILNSGKKRGFVIEGTPRELSQASRWPGASWRRREGVVRLPENLASWRALRDAQFERVCPTAGERLKALRDAHRSHRRRIRTAARRFKATGETDIPVPLKTLPYEHQVRAFGFSSSIPESALFMDQGTGKTLVAIAVAGKKYQDGEIKRIVVVCPKAVKPVWPKELKKHADFPYTVSVDKPPEPSGSVQYWITNYDRVKRELRRLRKWKPDMVILDESHRVKNRKADRTKAIWQLGAKVPFKIIMSGTPFGKCISEVWSQYKFLNPSIFGSDYSQFKQRYLVMGGYMNYQVVDYQNEDEFADKLHSVAFRVTKDECLDLPPLSYQRLYVEPDTKTKKIYKELEDKLFSKIGDEEVTINREVSKQIKLRQVVGGLVRTDSQELAHISGLKASTLKEVMEDRVDKKTLIFFSFTHEIELAKKMCKSLGMKYLTLQGSTPDREREEFETRFQEDEDISVALIQVQTGGEGMTLTAADLAIFYSPTFSFIGYSQARDRFYRIGQINPVTVLFIIMWGTVDERVVDVLESNGQLTDIYLNQKRDYGVITMAEAYKAADLAAELGLTAAELRRHLRALGAEKPEGGWQWAKKTDPSLVELRKQLKQRLKELASEDAPKRGRKKAEEAPSEKPAKKSRKKKAAEPEEETEEEEKKPAPKKSRKKKAE